MIHKDNRFSLVSISKSQIRFIKVNESGDCLTKVTDNKKTTVISVKFPKKDMFIYKMKVAMVAIFVFGVQPENVDHHQAA